MSGLLSGNKQPRHVKIESIAYKYKLNNEGYFSNGGNIVEKGENSGNQHFFLCFCKIFLWSKKKTT